MQYTTMAAIVAFTAFSHEAAAAEAGDVSKLPCWAAVDAVSRSLPELTLVDKSFEWRRLPVVFKCNGEGDIDTITIEWREGRPGLIHDARSAIASLGSRLTGDSANSIRIALERCISSAERSPTPVEVATGRITVSCSVTPAASDYSVRRRSDR